MFGWLQLWGVGGQKEQMDMLGHAQTQTGVPAGPVEHEDNLLGGAGSDLAGKGGYSTSKRGMLTVEASCPEPPTVNTAPPADAVHFVGQDQVDTLVRVRFSTSETYVDAVVFIGQLGFRLSNPCYEQDVTTASKPTWQPMGQESSFPSTQELLVRVTYLNAISWRQQLTRGAEVQAVEAPIAAAC